MRGLSPVRIVVLGVALVALLAAWYAPTDTYIFLPNEAHEVEPLVKLEREPKADPPGGIYFVDVLVRKATLVERLAPGLREGASLVPASELRAPGESDEERRKAELREMARSQRIAAAVALQALGHRGLVSARGVEVVGLARRAPAARLLREGDVIRGVDGERARTVCSLQRLLARRRPGEVVRVELTRDGDARTIPIRTIRDPETGRTLLGISATPAVELRKLPLKIEIDARGVGGPSAGLAFSLDVVEELGRDVARGRRVAVTGTIEPDGCVGSIGGVKQKAIGVRRSGIGIFVVPAGENAREARRYARGVRIVPVTTFQQALRALATLDRNRED